MQYCVLSYQCHGDECIYLDFALGGVKCLGNKYIATINTSGPISVKLLTMDETGRG